MSEKACSRCGVVKALVDFSPHRGQPLGRASYCRPCANAYQKELRSDPERRRRYAEAARVRRSDPEVAERSRATSRRWKQEHPEAARALYSKPEKRAQDRVRRQSPEGRELNRLTEQRRRARIAGAPVNDLSVQDWRDILDDFNHACAYCLAQGVPLQQEHMQPLSRGGSHTKANVVPACGPCNGAKGPRDLVQALQVLDSRRAA